MNLMVEKSDNNKLTRLKASDINSDTFIKKLINDAKEKKVSDIHIFTKNDETFYISYRINGELVDQMYGDTEYLHLLVNKLKLISKLKADQKRLPQWWEFTIEDVDVRIETIPHMLWEKVVLRILTKNQALLDLKSIWFLDNQIKKIENALLHKHWLIIIGWPTGSWKTTTLYAILNKLRERKIAIYTLEDPVEYKFEWITQISIKPEIGLTYQEWLKHILRADPDVILVWEIRDAEVAKLAVEASMTWHLVLATIHANTTLWIIQRLRGLWIDPADLLSSLRLLASQRLIRKLCSCKKKTKSEALKEYYKLHLKKFKSIREKVEKKIWEDNIYDFKPVWCDKCVWGYSGRTVLSEVVYVNDELAGLILNSDHMSISKWYDEINKRWSLGLFQDWLYKIIFWKITNLQEILPYKEW